MGLSRRDAYMHINSLPISLMPTNDGCYQDECIFRHEISYTSLVLVTMPCMRCKVEFQSAREWEDDEKEEGAEK